VKVILKKGALSSLLRSGQWVLGGAAVLMLGYCGFVLADTWMFQNRQRQLLDHLLQDRHTANGGAALQIADPALPKDPLPALVNGLIGRIDIPRLGVSVMIVEGTSGHNLRRAVGHISGTALPGQPGNVGLSGHRDTFFRPLRNIQTNDIITVTTLFGAYRYRVVSTRIVDPSNVAVLKPGGDEMLTLVTCYPFYFVGSAPNRFIVRAERVT
jgi:sortase A